MLFVNSYVILSLIIYAGLRTMVQDFAHAMYNNKTTNLNCLRFTGGVLRSILLYNNQDSKFV